MMISTWKRRPSPTALAGLMLLLTCLAAPLSGQETTTEYDGTDNGTNSGSVSALLEGKTIVRVEEDWLVDIAFTNDNSTAPEIVTVFGPDDPDSGLHAVFELNHGTYPTFTKGGMQIQSWLGGWFIAAKQHPNLAELSTTVERIRYTCVTRVAPGRIVLDVINGDSLTFGQFGNDRSLRLRLQSHRPNLNTYNANHSIRHSRVTFGANRVNQFVRTEIRYHTDTGEIIVDPTDVYVHRLVEADEGPPPVNEDSGTTGG
jgi:hypothetical protein